MTWEKTTDELYNRYLKKFPKLVEYRNYPQELKLGVPQNFNNVLKFYRTIAGERDDTEEKLTILDFKEEDLRHAAEAKALIPIVAILHTEIVGSIVLLKEAHVEEFGEIHPQMIWVAVLKQYRGQNIATCLYLAAFKYAEEVLQDIDVYAALMPTQVEFFRFLFNAEVRTQMTGKMRTGNLVRVRIPAAPYIAKIATR